ncbi:hypothetical protein F0562_007850 [Nyssa sinensis]|uniref:Peptidase S59 domain-containing protein n=1 Tax=Nyssa sinensis TaxID=561372 RepID=A0A5J5A6E2_9ASTE|nr:hypothetical protein F0562_007850 [Nyssa sinensis]
MPKLRHSDYYTEPRIQELAAKERAEPGFCRHVRDFVVGRHGYGSIKFIGETDVRRLDLEALIQFNNREVIVYMDESKKPPVGQGLNKPAEVTLLNIKCFDKKTGRHYTEGPKIEKYKEMLKRKAEDQGAEFVSYDAVKGEWRFRVSHLNALNNGMNPLVFVAYRQVIAALILAPFAFIWERNQGAPLSFGLFCKIFLLALCGPTVSLDLYFMALRFNSATFTSAIFNTIPVVTFIISILLRVEAVAWSSIYTGLKIFGIVMAVGGAMLLTFYQGPPLLQPSWHGHAGRNRGIYSHNELRSKKRLIEGPIFMFLSSIAWSLWLIMQSKVLKLYPAKLRLTTLQCFFGSIQSTMVAVAFVHNLNSWWIGWDIQLASIIYSGVLVTGASYGLQIWCIEKKGAFYVAMFTPLQLLVTALFSVLVWAEPLYCGSLLGGVLIVGGLYSVLWGRSKEESQLMLKEKPRDVERC